MKKIVIQAAHSSDTDNLISWLCVLFPECDIHIQQGSSGRHEHDSRCAYGASIKEKDNGGLESHHRT